MMELQKARLSTKLIFLAFGLGISSWAPMVPYAKTRLEINDAQLGLILFAFGAGALCAMPLTGWLVSRYGSRLVTLLSGIVVLVTLPFLAIVDTSLLMSAVLFFFGISTGALNVSINAQAVEVESRSDDAVMSGFHCLFSTGGLFGAVVVSFLLERQYDLLTCSIFVSLIMSALLLTQWKNLLIENPKETAISIQNEWKMPDIKILFLGVLCFIAFMAEGSMLDWSAEFLHSNLQYDPSIAGIGYALFSVFMAIGRLVGDQIIRKIGVLKVFQIGSLLSSSGFFIVTSFSWGYGELIGFCLIGLGASNIVPILFSASGKLSSISPNYALTVVTTIGYIGMLGGPAFIGLLAQVTNLTFAFGCIAFLLIGVSLSGNYKPLFLARS